MNPREGLATSGRRLLRIGLQASGGRLFHCPAESLLELQLKALKPQGPEDGEDDWGLVVCQQYRRRQKQMAFRTALPPGRERRCSPCAQSPSQRLLVWLRQVHSLRHWEEAALGRRHWGEKRHWGSDTGKRHWEGFPGKAALGRRHWGSGTGSGTGKGGTGKRHWEGVRMWGGAWAGGGLGGGGGCGLQGGGPAAPPSRALSGSVARV